MSLCIFSGESSGGMSAVLTELRASRSTRRSEIVLSGCDGDDEDSACVPIPKAGERSSAKTRNLLKGENEESAGERSSGGELELLPGSDGRGLVFATNDFCSSRGRGSDPRGAEPIIDVSARGEPGPAAGAWR